MFGNVLKIIYVHFAVSRLQCGEIKIFHKGYKGFHPLPLPLAVHKYLSLGRVNPYLTIFPKFIRYPLFRYLNISRIPFFPHICSLTLFFIFKFIVYPLFFKCIPYPLRPLRLLLFTFDYPLQFSQILTPCHFVDPLPLL